MNLANIPGPSSQPEIFSSLSELLSSFLVFVLFMVRLTLSDQSEFSWQNTNVNYLVKRFHDSKDILSDSHHLPDISLK